MRHLAVVSGLTYTDLSQVLNRWLMPTYQTGFRWTGNRADSEDTTTWVFLNLARHIRLPEPVPVVDEYVVDLGLEAITCHWSNHYGIDRARWAGVFVSEPAPPLESLFAGLTAEMRLALVLRFLRRRPLERIAAQLGIRPETARQRIAVALGGVARRIGLRVDPIMATQVDRVSNYIDEMVANRRPVRFEVLPQAWPTMIGACHVHAAIVGNDLPAQGFVRSLERRLGQCSERRLVTHLRISSE